MPAPLTRWVAGAAWLALGCNLESALGVDDDGSSDGPDSQTTASASTDSGSADSTGPGPATDDGTSDGTGPQPAACGGRQLRIATFNIESVNPSGSASFEALVDVLQRIDADIVCMQEVEETETATLFALATAAGYSDTIQANAPPAIGGELTNACMSRSPLSIFGSFGGAELSPDGAANDVGRDILVVRANLASDGEAPCALGLVTLHLKSGQVQQDWFRRQVEAERVAQAVARYQQEHPDEPMVILGDLNESIDDPALGSVFPRPPVGLPESYQLGSDIVFPLTYDPFATFASLGFEVTEATQEDSDRDQTWNDAVRLDYVLRRGAPALDAEVYNACRDNGVDDGPVGGSVDKAGSPLACEVSDVASDHFPVLVDLLLP